jgi:hypothetical protein
MRRSTTARPSARRWPVSWTALDTIIDDLSDGLNQAVTHAVQQAVTAAVQEAVEGVLQAVTANPELLRKLAAPLPPSTDPDAEQPNVSPASDRPAGPVARVRGWVSARLRQAGAACAAVKRRASSLLAGVYDRPWRPWLLTVLALGTAAVAATYFYGPLLAAGAGVLTAWLMARVLSARDALRRLLARGPIAA